MSAGRRVKVLGDLAHGRVPDGAVYVGRKTPTLRGSRLANPHQVGRCRRCRNEHDAAGAVQAYARYLSAKPELMFEALLLIGRDLACWCPLDQPCHGDVLLELHRGGR